MEKSNLKNEIVNKNIAKGSLNLTDDSNKNKNIDNKGKDKPESDKQIKERERILSDEEKLKPDKLNLQKMVMLFKALHTMNIIKNDNKPIKIIDKLFIGSVGVANSKDNIIAEGITHIVNATSSLKNVFEDTFKYLKLDDLLDSPENDIKKYFPITGKFIKNAIDGNGAVLVHCHAGVSRSSTIIIAYLIEYEKMSFEKALEHCKLQREKINPNPGFQKQLKEYEEEIRNK